MKRRERVKVEFVKAKIATFKVEAGDVVVVTVPKTLRDFEIIKRIGEHVERCIPTGCKVLVVEDGFTVKVVRPPPGIHADDMRGLVIEEPLGAYSTEASIDSKVKEIRDATKTKPFGPVGD